jgi:hypothetical protein
MIISKLVADGYTRHDSLQACTLVDKSFNRVARLYQLLYDTPTPRAAKLAALLQSDPVNLAHSCRVSLGSLSLSGSQEACSR